MCYPRCSRGRGRGDDIRSRLLTEEEIAALSERAPSGQ